MPDMSSPGELKIVRDAWLFDPGHGVDRQVADVLIEDGRLAAIQSGIDVDAPSLVADGKYLFPAFCDPHVHFRTPGQTHKEDIESGCRAALAGGFTSVTQMPNTAPVVDSPGLVKELTRDEPIELRVLSAATLGSKSRELADLPALLAAGAVGFTDDGMPVSDDELMRAALGFSQEHGVPITSHAEDLTIGDRGAVRSGATALKLGVSGWDPRREYEMVKRDIRLAEETGGWLHVCHVSTRQSVALIREAKGRGVNVTAEVTPHHLTLTVDDVPEIGPNAKMNPPLGDDEDREALIDALRDGTIDCIATDHAPHTRDEKSQSLEDAPFGAIGLENSFSVCWTELVLGKKISLTRLIEAMCHRPREIYGLEPVGLFEGSRADLVLVDLEGTWIVDPEDFRSKGRNCPFAGRDLEARIVWTMYRGEIHSFNG